MKTIMLGNSSLVVPAISVGCMRISDMDKQTLQKHITFCLENGLNFFDHADIYGGGSCESVFGDAIREMGIPRDDMLIQSKCGIVPGVMYDFSKEHILNSVEASLKRLGTDYLDVLVLHRPDALMEPEKVAEAFDFLQSRGMVRYFGVSNHRPMQIELLKKYVKQELLVNQLQLSLPVAGMISGGLEMNMMTDGAVNRDGEVLDYCRLHDITIQVWSPFQYGFFEGVFIGNNAKFPELNECLTQLAKKYETTETAIATAWILRHPANMQMVAGTTNTGRLSEIMEGSCIHLEREEWYELYLKAGHILP